MKNILIYGSGEFGHVVKNLSFVCGYTFCGFIDDFHTDVTGVVGDFDFVKKNFNPEKYAIAIAIGYKYLSQRRKIYKNVKTNSYQTPSLVHPSSYVDKSVIIKDGVFVMANSTIDFNVKIDSLVVVWPAAVINHDSKIGRNVFISPNATICGFVGTGDDIFIGASATVIDHTYVPSGAFIKAGSIHYQNEQFKNNKSRK